MNDKEWEDHIKKDSNFTCSFSRPPIRREQNKKIKLIISPVGKLNYTLHTKIAKVFDNLMSVCANSTLDYTRNKMCEAIFKEEEDVINFIDTMKSVYTLIKRPDVQLHIEMEYFLQEHLDKIEEAKKHNNGIVKYIISDKYYNDVQHDTKISLKLQSLDNLKQLLNLAGTEDVDYVLTKPVKDALKNNRRPPSSTSIYLMKDKAFMAFLLEDDTFKVEKIEVIHELY